MRAKLCSRETLAWLGLIAVTLVVLIGSFAPLNAARHLDFSREFHLKPFHLDFNLSKAAVYNAILKLNHLVGFAIFFVFAYSATSGRFRMTRAAICTFLFAVSIEIAQGFVMTRSGQLQDVVAALLGVYVGLTAVYGYREMAASLQSR